jgi:NAD(P)-dependent dehydrogenase (short-subunit alcohol dehydrogenase family)
MNPHPQASGEYSTPPPLIRLPDLVGGTALVTGASRGIGKAVVAALCAHEVRCYGIAHEGFSDPANPHLVPIICDLHDPAAIEAAVGRVAQEVGKLDYVINVAGIDPKARLEVGDAQLWDSVFDLNLRAYYLVIRACAPLLREGHGKSIVNVSSINYRVGLVGRSIYSSTKAGILGLTTGLARELGAQGIRINTISPGWVFTERQIEEYFAAADSEKYYATLAQEQSIALNIHPHDIANHILFYLSQVSRASTGHNCVVDAGWILE